MESWEPGTPGVLTLPSGRLIRGRGLRNPLPEGAEPTYGLYLLGKPPPQVNWEHGWLKWPDFWLPAADAAAKLRTAWERADGERVELACGGGRGRTGTALACIAVLDGVPAHEAVAFVRRNYDRRAVETPWQKRYVQRFTG
ncbi:protein phosphatase [Streptomyces sp. YC504]|uniref:Protein phosphatase n=1 Tax=Streptomyces mesophilus TaxID=1775132 RepID=A0A6G4XQF8_9ACTN|nr:protein phosphatase [Streptomyces mesophilus]NGO79432.1 protein phosphatase [Streptomyces mesophilus]